MLVVPSYASLVAERERQKLSSVTLGGRLFGLEEFAVIEYVHMFAGFGFEAVANSNTFLLYSCKRLMSKLHLSPRLSQYRDITNNLLISALLVNRAVRLAILALRIRLPLEVPSFVVSAVSSVEPRLLAYRTRVPNPELATPGKSASDKDRVAVGVRLLDIDRLLVHLRPRVRAVDLKRLDFEFRRALAHHLHAVHVHFAQARDGVVVVGCPVVWLADVPFVGGRLGHACHVHLEAVVLAARGWLARLLAESYLAEMCQWLRREVCEDRLAMLTLRLCW